MNVFQYLWNRLFPKPSVEQIVGSFQKTIDQLETLAAAEEERAKREAEAAEQCQKRCNLAKAEGRKAKAVASNLSSLVGSS